MNEYGAILSPTATLIAGFIVWLVYTRQKKEAIKRAALAIIINIDEIEEKIDSLFSITKNHTDIDSIFRYWENFSETQPILITNIWEKNNFYIVDKLGRNDFKILVDFYSSITAIEIARSAIQVFILNSRNYKNESIQQAHVNRAIEEYFGNIKMENPLNDICLCERIRNNAINIKKVTDLALGDFLPTTHAVLLSNSLHKYNKVSRTPAYKALDKLAAGNFYIWF